MSAGTVLMISSKELDDVEMGAGQGVEQFVLAYHFKLGRVLWRVWRRDSELLLVTRRYYTIRDGSAYYGCSKRHGLELEYRDRRRTSIRTCEWVS